MAYFDDGPEDGEVDDGPETYAGPMFEVWIHGQEKPLVTFPWYFHDIVMGDDSLEECLSEDLREGMAIQVNGQVGLVDRISRGLWCGLIEGTFLGEPTDDEFVVLRKKFVREIYPDGRLNWKLVEIDGIEDICPSCGRPMVDEEEEIVPEPDRPDFVEP